MVYHIEGQVKAGKLRFTVEGWRGFGIGPLEPQITAHGKVVKLRAKGKAKADSPNNTEVVYYDASEKWSLAVVLRREGKRRVRIQGKLGYHGVRPARLDDFAWTGENKKGNVVALGKHAATVRIMEQSAYLGQIRSVGQIISGSDGRCSLDGQAQRSCSTDVSLWYDPKQKAGLLIGYERFDRFRGTVTLGINSSGGKRKTVMDNVDLGSAGICKLYPSSEVSAKNIGFHYAALAQCLGGIAVQNGDNVVLEEMVIEVGSKPEKLLADYAERVAKYYEITSIPKAFANWCSWYPLRLGVSEETMLANARAAKAHHLDALGLRFIQADLGWEKDNIPTYFEENERFGHGLTWLSEELEALGFELGVWKGFTCVAASHPVAREHPEWLVHNKKGELVNCGTWFWEPHDVIYAIDVTHPEARQWIYDNVKSLAERGVKYLKWDFGGALAAKGERYDARVAASETYEGMRMTSALVQEAMDSVGGHGLVLDCTAMEGANIGNFDLLYTNYDTGNNGLGFTHLRGVYESMGLHLFKQNRWGLLQPSCVTTHGPGTLEEARMRATATFLSGGHVDISDDLTSLPEDRWPVITSILPPMTTVGRAVDLYEPIRIRSCDYEALCRGEACDRAESEIEPQGATVWDMPIHTDWDDWQLLGLMNYFHNTDMRGHPTPLSFEIPLSVIGLKKNTVYWLYEFWSGSFLEDTGVVPLAKQRYQHPGDYGRLFLGIDNGTMNLTFSGPAVKLIAIRKQRRHPWPIGTSFHQSCGLELGDVRWEDTSRCLSGVVRRPAGESGWIVMAGWNEGERTRAWVNGKKAVLVPGANGSLRLPIVTADKQTTWRVEG